MNLFLRISILISVGVIEALLQNELPFAQQQLQPQTPETRQSGFDLQELPDDLGKIFFSSLAETEAAISEEFSFAVDFVYTWHNAQDPVALSNYETRVGSVDQSTLPPGTLNSKRFNNADELKFSLRSVHLHAPWVRNVFVLMQDNITPPPWMDTNLVKVIRHSQILPSSSLPTFNSFALETSLHHIPGLSQQFVYFNDDQFLNKAVTKGTFFTSSGQPRVWPGWSGPWNGEESYDRAVRNSLNQLEKGHHFSNWNSDQCLHHQMKALSISMMSAAEQEFHTVVSQTSSHPFRSKSDIWMPLIASVKCVDEVQCVKSSIPRNSFVVLGKNPESPAAVMSTIRSSDPVMFCINDSVPENSDNLRHELEKHFPTKSKYEK